jgi:hypothetical protein
VGNGKIKITFKIAADFQTFKSFLMWPAYNISGIMGRAEMQLNSPSQKGSLLVCSKKNAINHNNDVYLHKAFHPCLSQYFNHH